ncbi:MAG TPA: universal stress protein, partial [Candidatus Binatia bacterium]|nr:universal stress protein [Candidatus Binatia bacterium]
MSELKRIIVGHDLRAGGETALKSAMVLARQCDAALRLVHVVEPPHLYQKISHPFASQYGLEEMAQKAGARLREAGASEELANLRVEYEVHTGKPFVELIIARRAWQADLIVVGGPSEQHGHFLGSTGERVVRKAMVPVLVAKKTLNANAKRFLVPTDFSPGARKAAEEALVLAESFGGSIFFLHVLDLTPLYAYPYEDEISGSLAIPPLTPEDIQPDWEGFLATLPLGKIPWENRTEEGYPAKTIVQHAEAIHADVIVMGTHGRSGLEHMLLGSV